MTTVIQETILYLLFLCTNVTQWVIYLNATMKRRRPLKVLIIYSFVKSLLVNVLFKTLIDNLFVNNEIIKVIYSGVIILVAILTYVVLLYTFNEHFTKIAIIGMAVDVFASLIGYASILFTNLIAGKALFAVEPPLYPTDFLSPFIAFLFIHIVLKVIKRFEIRIKSWDVKYKKLTMSVFIVYMCYSFYSMNHDFDRNVDLIGAFSAMLFSYILVIYVNHYHRTMIWENEMLKKQQFIAKMQYEGVVLQSEQIEHLQSEIDIQMEKVLQLSKNADNKSEQIKNYIVSLKQRAEDISVGMLCDDKYLDFVLYEAIQKCKTKGIETAFNLQGYKTNAQISKNLANDIKKILNDSVKKAKKKINFSVATIKGNVIIKLETDGKEKIILWNQ